MLESSEPKLVDFKELAVLVPSYAGALAVTYDVGYFYGLDPGLFSLFTLSEHVLFAINALPMAFFCSLCACPLIFVDNRKLAGRLDEQSDRIGRKSIGLISISLLAVLSLGSWYYFQSFALVGGIALSYGILRLKEYRHNRIVIAAGGAAIVLFVGFAMGAEFGGNALKPGTPAYRVFLSNETVDARLIRSGERGLLVYQPSKHELMLIPWGDIHRITKQTRPSSSLLAPKA
jgi:hypothetical protein